MSKNIAILLLVAALIFLLIPLITGELHTYILILPAAIINLLGAHSFWRKSKKDTKQ
ncbi:MAG: hypothetical protein ACKVTZ_05095 [Bacteroidia bacterium]